MPSPPRTLEVLRQEIDAIDSELHRLLMARASVVVEVAELKQSEGAKGSLAFYRPAREAQVLRRLVDRHTGPFPIPSLVRVWREIIGAALSIETRVTVAVRTDARPRGLWDVARDHFGAASTYTPMQKALQVVGAVRDGAAAIGVVPTPEEADEEPWWPALAADNPSLPRIVARLPFAPGRNAAAALVVAVVEPEPTGDDRGYIAVEANRDVSIATLAATLKAAGIEARAVAQATRPDFNLHLLETAGLVCRDDPRLARAIADGQRRITRIVPLGGYPVPLATA